MRAAAAFSVLAIVFFMAPVVVAIAIETPYAWRYRTLRDIWPHLSTLAGLILFLLSIVHAETLA